MITINNKTSENEVIDVEENSSYDENKGNTNEALESDDHCENNSIIDDESDNKKKHMYPSDCYSFLSLYGPIKNPGK